MVFEAEQVLVRQKPVGSLFREKFGGARSFTFIHPRLYLTEDLDSGKYNYQKLQDLRVSKSQRQQQPTELPELLIREGEIQFGETTKGAYTPLGVLPVSGNLMTTEDQAGVYQFLLRQDGLGPEGPTIRGRLDMQKLAVSVQLDRFTFSGAQRHALPHRLRAWWDQLDPEGTLPEAKFQYDPDPAVGFNVVLEVKDVALTLPYGELKQRLTHVTGRFTLIRDRVVIAGLTGEAGEIHYGIEGQVRGLTRTIRAPFDLTVSVAPLVVPADPQNLLALPKFIQEQFPAVLAERGFYAPIIKVGCGRRRAGRSRAYFGAGRSRIGRQGAVLQVPVSADGRARKNQIQPGPPRSRWCRCRVAGRGGRMWRSAGRSPRRTTTRRCTSKWRRRSCPATRTCVRCCRRTARR